MEALIEGKKTDPKIHKVPGFKTWGMGQYLDSGLWAHFFIQIWVEI